MVLPKMTCASQSTRSAGLITGLGRPRFRSIGCAGVIETKRSASLRSPGQEDLPRWSAVALKNPFVIELPERTRNADPSVETSATSRPECAGVVTFLGGAPAAPSNQEAKPGERPRKHTLRKQPRILQTPGPSVIGRIGPIDLRLRGGRLDRVPLPRCCAAVTPRADPYRLWGFGRRGFGGALQAEIKSDSLGRAPAPRSSGRFGPERRPTCPWTWPGLLDQCLRGRRL